MDALLCLSKPNQKLFRTACEVPCIRASGKTRVPSDVHFTCSGLLGNIAGFIDSTDIAEC